MKNGVLWLCAGLAVGVGVLAAGAAPVAETLRIGSSAGGRAVEVIAVGEPGADALGRARDQRPALLIVAGMRGHDTIGPEVARALVERLAGEHAALLADRTVYVIASANPDGAGRWADRSMARAAWGRSPLGMDFDGDGRTDEDGAEDLNGDGLITVMRVPAPLAGRAASYGIVATHLIDPDDGRLMREPVAKDGELATHALITEGIDNDGDGAFNEDGWGGVSGGGVDFDMHWPTHWPEHADGAGLYPLERPAARAITEWVQSRPNIVSVLVYGAHDTLSKVPASGKFGPVGKVSTGIEKDDEDAYGVVNELFKEAAGITGPGGEADRAGSFLQWAYADLGVYAFGAPVWVRPDLVKADKKGGFEEPENEPAVPVDVPGDPEPVALELAAERDRASLAERGVPADLIAFIYMTPDERAAEMTAMEQRGPESLAAIMQTIRELPMDVQQRLMALGQGNPDPHPAEVTDADRAAADAVVGSGGQRVEEPGKADGEKGRAKAGSSDGAKWLAWMDESGMDGFVEWAAFEHPQLGPVEIGGFVPGARVNPPEDLFGGLADRQAAFVSGLLGVLPALEVDEPLAERVGDGLWRVTVVARNTGRLATVPGSGRKAKRLPGVVMVIDPDQKLGRGAIVSGEPMRQFQWVEGSGAAVREGWLLAVPDGGTVRVEVRSARFGDRVFDVRLDEGSGEGGAR